MSNNLNFQKSNFAFLMMPAAELEITEELFDRLVASENRTKVKLATIDWLYYEPGGDEDIYAWNIPGPKLLYTEDVNSDTGRAIAEDFKEKVKAETGHDMQLVFIDIAQLVKMQE